MNNRFYFITVRVTGRNPEKPNLKYKPVSMTGCFLAYSLENAKKEAVYIAENLYKIEGVIAEFKVTKVDLKKSDYVRVAKNNTPVWHTGWFESTPGTNTIPMRIEDMSECPECLQGASKQELKKHDGYCFDCWIDISLKECNKHLEKFPKCIKCNKPNPYEKRFDGLCVDCAKYGIQN